MQTNYLRPKSELPDWVIDKLDANDGRPMQLTGQIWAAIDNGRVRAWIATAKGEQAIDLRRYL